MVNRMFACGAAILLLGAAVVAVATSVQGLDFERQGEITESGTVSTLDWADADAGKVRLELAPTEGALAPSAQLSLFAPSGEHLSTFVLDGAWPSLDHHVADPGRYILVVHSAIDASVTVLTQEDRAVTLEDAPVSTEEIVLFEGAGDHVATRVAVERTVRDLHVGLTFQGTAQDLHVEAFNDAGDSVLLAQLPTADAAESARLLPTLNPEKFSAGTLLVRVSATSFSGSVAMELVGMNAAPTRMVPIGGAPGPAPPQPQDPPAAPEPKDADAEGPGEGAIVAEFAPGTPIAFRLPAGVTSVFVISGDDCGEGIVFNADDEVAGVGHISTEEGATVWDDEEGLVAAEIPITGDGEFVLVLVNSWRDGMLFVPGVEEGDIEVRELDVAEITTSVEDSGDLPLLGSREPSSAQLDVPAGLFGFSYYVNGADVERDVRLYGPDGALLHESSGFVSTFGFELMQEMNGTHPLAGPPGLYTIETNGSSALPGSVEFTLLSYER